MKRAGGVARGAFAPAALTSALAMLAALAAAACSKGAAGAAGGGAAGAGGGPPAMPVEVAVARQDTAVDAVSATGQIEAIQSIELRPEVEGRIVDILFQEGATVAAGTPLFKIDDAELAAQVARAEADRDVATQALERTRTLIAQQASSASDLERAQAAARGSQAQLDLLRLRLARTVVRAPFGGVTGQRTVSLGDYVTTSTRLVSLHTVSPQRATLEIPERYAEQLRRGLRVGFQVAALRGHQYTGVVDFVDPVVRLPARTILVKAEVPNPRGELQPGMFIEGRLVFATRPRAVLVPEDAVIPLGGATFVWVAAGGKAVRRTVQLGIRVPGWVEVESGVAAGEQVVVGGAERLFEGAGLRPTVVTRRGS